MMHSAGPSLKKQLETWEHIYGLSRLIPKKMCVSLPIDHTLVMLLLPEPINLNLICSNCNIYRFMINKLGQV